jgi:hypothetical protein
MVPNMIVKCIAKFGKDLPSDCLLPDYDIDIKHEFPLILNNYYIVYGIRLFSNYIWYYLCDENYDYYPRLHPSPLFEVTDGQLSRYWIYSFTRGENSSSTRTIWTYPEWIEIKYYYDLLTDGEEKEVKIFEKYKYLMDLEFPNPSIQEHATALDDEWLMCPICIDAWQSTSKDGMVICPKCERMLHNPRYEKRIIRLK